MAGNISDRELRQDLHKANKGLGSEHKDRETGHMHSQRFETDRQTHTQHQSNQDERVLRANEKPPGVGQHLQTGHQETRRELPSQLESMDDPMPVEKGHGMDPNKAFRGYSAGTDDPANVRQHPRQ